MFIWYDEYEDERICCAYLHPRPAEERCERNSAGFVILASLA